MRSVPNHQEPVTDPESGESYYFNVYTNETTWDKPESLTVFEKQQAAALGIQKAARGRKGRARALGIKEQKEKETLMRSGAILSRVWIAGANLSLLYS